MNPFEIFNPVLDFHVQCNECFGSQLTSIAAAWATQGYYVQADIIWHLGNTGFSYYAPLVYVAAAFAGLMSMAMNMPSRTYMWFFLGPVLYNFLVFTTHEAGGVNWQIGSNTDGSPYYGNQSEVWKLAETGLVNTNIVARTGMTVDAEGGPSETVEVANIFLRWDALLSEFVQNMVAWTGVHRQEVGQGNTNIQTSGPGNIDRDWSILSNLKWGMISNITEAKLTDPNMLDAFATFMASECGDIVAGEINPGAYNLATKSTSGAVPASVFKNSTDYTRLKEQLGSQIVPTPQSLQKVFGKSRIKYSFDNTSATTEIDDHSGFWNFNSNTKTVSDGGGFIETVNCLDYFYFVIKMMRWQAAHSYYQLIESGPKSIQAGKESKVLYNLYYGWGIRDTSGALLEENDIPEFTRNLQMVYVVKNSMLFAPDFVDVIYAPSEQTESYVQTSQRTTSSQNKFGEIYSWALMVPYIQGFALYFLAIAYPLVCVVMILPGLHKMFLTWLKYWAWAKLWDVGFALIMVLERSVWAMVGNNSQYTKLFGKVSEMGSIGQGLPSGSVMVQMSNNNPPRIEEQTGVDVDSTIRFFDQALSLSGSMDLDLANSYYIYLMAALYFAVPAVSGMLVGGASSLASSALDKMTNVAQGAGTGYSANVNHRASAGTAALQQEAQMKDMRQGGLAVGALRANNMGEHRNLASSALDGQGQMLGSAGAMIDNAARQNQTHAGLIDGLYGTAGRALHGAGQPKPPAPGTTPVSAAPSSEATTGSGPTGLQIPQIPDKLKAAAKHLPKASGLALHGANQFARWEAASEGIEGAVGVENDRAAVNAQSRGAGMEAQQFRGQSNRLGSASQFSAGTARFNGMNRYNLARGAQLAVMGAAFTPGTGGKPDQMEGAAYMGHLGSDGQNQARYFDTGGQFGQGVGAAKSHLSAQAAHVGRNFTDRTNPGSPLSEVVRLGGKGFGNSAVGQIDPGYNGAMHEITSGGATPVQAAPGGTSPSGVSAGGSTGSFASSGSLGRGTHNIAPAPSMTPFEPAATTGPQNASGYNYGSSVGPYRPAGSHDSTTQGVATKK